MTKKLFGVHVTKITVIAKGTAVPEIRSWTSIRSITDVSIAHVKSTCTLSPTTVINGR